MEIRYCPLFSGSSGNALYVGCDGANLLVDAGVSGARVAQLQAQYGPNKLEQAAKQYWDAIKKEG